MSAYLQQKDAVYILNFIQRHILLKRYMSIVEFKQLNFTELIKVSITT